MRRLLLACAFAYAACATKPPEAAKPEPEQTAKPEPESEPASASSGAQPPGEEAEPAASKKEPRTVKYIMTTAGLEVEVEGVRFMPKAAPIKSGNGWGVRISVDVKVMDEEAHSLLDPENGPLAFAGSVDRGGEVLRIGDKRKGEGEKLIAQGDKLRLERDWPGKGGDKPLSAGQTLTLEVGLWGLGPDADQRHPVRDFFQVKMRAAAGGKPQPAIMPPPSANH
jgi:hypothetical protein